MISRPKALFCLVSPSHFLSDPPPCLPVDGPQEEMEDRAGKEDDSWLKKVRQRIREIPGQVVKRPRTRFCFIDYWRKSGRKQSIVLWKQFCLSFLFFLGFLSLKWWMGNLWPPISSLVAVFFLTHTHTHRLDSVGVWSMVGWQCGFNDKHPEQLSQFICFTYYLFKPVLYQHLNIKHV